MITSLNQLNSLINQNPIYILSSFSEYLGKYGTKQEIDFTDSEEFIPIIDDQQGFIITYNNIDDLLNDLRNSIKYINLTGGGDDDTFDYQPDLMLSWYQGLQLLRSYKALPTEDITNMTRRCISLIQGFFQASANNEILTELGDIYEDLANKFNSLPTE